jgi:acetolactate synthase-1/2/3 large subunit
MMTFTTTSGALALAKEIRALGVHTVIGTVGHGNLAFVDALLDADLRFLTVHHEQVAAHAADAQFRISGELGVVTTTVGPGFTNLATGLGDALLDSSAMVVICGGVPTEYVGLEPLQELSLHSDDAQHELFRHLTKRVLRAQRAADLPGLFRRAARIALTGNPGPVILHVPLDLFSAAVEVILPPAPRALTIQRPGPAPEGIADAARMIAAAKRPLIYSGGGALLSGASKAVLALVERHGIPISTTMSGQGIIDERHRLCAGMTGVVGTRPANEIVREADCLIALGTRFPEMDASNWRPDFFAAIPPAGLIHIDVDPSQINKVLPADIGLVSDVTLAVEALLVALDQLGPAADRSAWHGRVDAAKKSWADDLAPIRASEAFPFEPAAVLPRLRAVMPEDAVLVTGVGIRHAVGQHFNFFRPRTQVVGSGFGTMGQEVAAVIGAKLAAPDVPVVGVVGDGAVLACLAAWPTAVTAGIDATWIVLDNGGYASISVYQHKHFGRHTGTSFAEGHQRVPFDYAALARSFGMRAHTVESAADLERVVTAAMGERGPSVVVLPMTPTPRLIASGHWDVNDILAATAHHAERRSG